MKSLVMYMPDLGELLLEDGLSVKVPQQILEHSDIDLDALRVKCWAQQEGHISAATEVAYIAD